MEKASNVGNILFTGSPEEQDEGLVFKVGMAAAALFILSKIASPYMEGPLTVNFLKHPAIPFVAAGLGVLKGIKQSIAESPGNRSAQTCKEHAKGFGRQLLNHAIAVGFFVGVGYFFPRAVPATCIQLIATTATIGAIRVGQELIK